MSIENIPEGPLHRVQVSLSTSWRVRLEAKFRVPQAAEAMPDVIKENIP